MKFIDPNKELDFKPKSAPGVTAVYRQPSGATISTTTADFYNLYLDRFLVRLEGMEVPESLKGQPWSKILPTTVANGIVAKIIASAHLTEEEQEG